MTGKPAEERSDGLLHQIVAGQAAAEQRFTELFRRMGKAEAAAGEARDIAKEISLILREQNALTKIAEVRTDAHQLVADLRADVVVANKTVRTDLAALGNRVQALEDLRQTGTGMVKGAKLAVEAAKVIVAMGGGALLLKFLGG